MQQRRAEAQARQDDQTAEQADASAQQEVAVSSLLAKLAQAEGGDAAHVTPAKIAAVRAQIEQMLAQGELALQMIDGSPQLVATGKIADFKIVPVGEALESGTLTTDIEQTAALTANSDTQEIGVGAHLETRLDVIEFVTKHSLQTAQTRLLQSIIQPQNSQILHLPNGGFAVLPDDCSGFDTIYPFDPSQTKEVINLLRACGIPLHVIAPGMIATSLPADELVALLNDESQQAAMRVRTMGKTIARREHHPDALRLEKRLADFLQLMQDLELDAEVIPVSAIEKARQAGREIFVFSDVSGAVISFGAGDLQQFQSLRKAHVPSDSVVNSHLDYIYGFLRVWADGQPTIAETLVTREHTDLIIQPEDTYLLALILQAGGFQVTIDENGFTTNAPAAEVQELLAARRGAQDHVQGIDFASDDQDTVLTMLLERLSDAETTALLYLLAHREIPFTNNTENGFSLEATPETIELAHRMLLNPGSLWAEIGEAMKVITAESLTRY